MKLGNGDVLSKIVKISYFQNFIAQLYIENYSLLHLLGLESPWFPAHNLGHVKFWACSYLIAMQRLEMAWALLLWW